MRVLSLCSGIGLIDLGLEWAGFDTVQFCEIDGYCQKVLEQRFPGVPIHDDLNTFQPEEGAADVIAAGFPCQPFSLAGIREGASDPRYLWPGVARCIRMVRPRYVILENVPGITSLGLDEVLGDVAEAGYDAEWTCFTAASVGAPHRRDRWWLVAAHPDTAERWDAGGGFFRAGWASEALADADVERRDGRSGRHHWTARRTEPQDRSQVRQHNQGWWAAEPAVGRNSDGGTGRMDGGRISEAEKNTDEVLRSLWRATGTQTIRETPGGIGRVLQEGLLRQGVHGGRLCQRCAITCSAQEAGIEIPWRLLRVLWGDGEPPRAPHRRAAVEQLRREHPDVVRFLSCIPPPPCATCWADGSWEDGIARTAHGHPHRVDRIRTLGNAVVPQCAQVVGLRIQQFERGCA